MQKVDGEIKTGMSNPAKILLAYMRLSNCWDSKELAGRFTVPLRTIQRWKMECAANVSDATGAIDGAPSEHGHNVTRATDATDGAPLTPDMALAQDVHSCAGANTESLRDTSLKDVSVSQSAREDFNDATQAMVADVLEAMGPIAREAEARKWLTGTIAAYGAERTARAWTIITAKRAAGEPVPNPLALWSKTAQGLKPSTKTPAPASADVLPFKVTVAMHPNARPRDEVMGAVNA